METLHRFHDEWLVRWALKIPNVTLAWIGEVKRHRTPYLSQALADEGLATPALLNQIVETAWRVTPWEPSASVVDRSVLATIPARVCRRHLLVPISRMGWTVDVAMANPVDPEALDDVLAYTKCAPVAYFSLPARLIALLDELFPVANVAA